MSYEETMCHTVEVSLEDGTTIEVCVNHPYENSHIDNALKNGQQPDITVNDIKRALDYYYKTQKTYDFSGKPDHPRKKGRPSTVSVASEDMDMD